MGCTWLLLFSYKDINQKKNYNIQRQKLNPCNSKKAL